MIVGACGESKSEIMGIKTRDEVRCRQIARSGVVLCGFFFDTNYVVFFKYSHICKYFA